MKYAAVLGLLSLTPGIAFGQHCYSQSYYAQSYVSPVYVQQVVKEVQPVYVPYAVPTTLLLNVGGSYQPPAVTFSVGTSQPAQAAHGYAAPQQQLQGECNTCHGQQQQAKGYGNGGAQQQQLNMDKFLDKLDRILARLEGKDCPPPRPRPDPQPDPLPPPKPEPVPGGPKVIEVPVPERKAPQAQAPRQFDQRFVLAANLAGVACRDCHTGQHAKKKFAIFDDQGFFIANEAQQALMVASLKSDGSPGASMKRMPPPEKNLPDESWRQLMIDGFTKRD
jgi:hypothetical protein